MSLTASTKPGSPRYPMTTTATAQPNNTPTPAETTRPDTMPGQTEPGAQTHPPRWHHGHVVWYDSEKGFGFLRPDAGPEVFVDYQVIDMPGFKTLLAGQPVTFLLADTPRGTQPHASCPAPRHTSARYRATSIRPDPTAEQPPCPPDIARSTPTSNRHKEHHGASITHRRHSQPHQSAAPHA
ncbi:cold-shock protein [Nocardia colli]|uniref:cold-shock protein n=1 Tax=Nocardia colli TaxID=2545717 RepID=UPI0035DF9647